MFTGSLPPASNRADWSEIFQIFDDETGELIDLSNAAISVQVRGDDCCPLNATVVVTALGTFQASIPVEQMKSLRSGTYDVGCIMTANGETIQEIIGSLPVLNGVIR